MDWNDDYYLFEVNRYEKQTFLFGPSLLENEIPYDKLKLYRFIGEHTIFHYLIIDDNSHSLFLSNLYFGNDDKLYDFLKSKNIEIEELTIDTYEFTRKKNIKVKFTNGYALTIRKTYLLGGCHTILYNAQRKELLNASSITVHNLEEIPNNISSIQWSGNSIDDPTIKQHFEKFKKQKKKNAIGFYIFFIVLAILMAYIFIVMG